MVNKVHPPTPSTELIETVAAASIAVHANSDDPLAVIRNMRPIPMDPSKMVGPISLDEQIYSLKMAGYTSEQIAYHLQTTYEHPIHPSQVDKALQKASSKNAVRTPEQLAFHAQLEVDRHEMAIKSIWTSVTEGNLQAIDRYKNLSAEKRKMLGLDAPDISVQIRSGSINGVDYSKLTTEELQILKKLQRKASAQTLQGEIGE